MLHRHVYHNGDVVAVPEARLSPGQSGLFCGWGVFTTVRLYSGRPFALDRHWRRLERDAGLLGVSLPIDREGLGMAIRLLSRRNDVGDGAARVYMVRNRVGWWSGGEDLPETDVLVFTSELPPSPTAAALAVDEYGLDTRRPLAGAKILSWLDNAWRLERAREAGFDEVVLLNERGEVAECTSANVFCVSGGRALTPPLASGCLDGVTREVLLELDGDAVPTVREAILRPSDLLEASEIFITSTSRELLPVAAVSGHPIPRVDGPVTRALAAAFRQRVEAMLAEEST